MQAKVVAYIKGFEVCIYGGIGHIYAPKYNKKQHTIICILPYGISKSQNSFGLAAYGVIRLLYLVVVGWVVVSSKYISLPGVFVLIYISKKKVSGGTQCSINQSSI